MAQGFVYVLLNPSFPDQVKIGRTEKDSEIRARKLWTTGVPTPFLVIYDELVSDCEVVESLLHERFAAYRVSSCREFFRIPVREAICVLQEAAAKYRIHDITLSNRRDILQILQHRYEDRLKPDITAVRIVQLSDVCFLEVVRHPYRHARDEIIERMDLDIFGEGDKKMFPTINSIDVNTQHFLDKLKDYDLIMTGAPLFTNEACKQIADEWEEGGKLELYRSRKSICSTVGNSSEFGNDSYFTI
ncbi:GIY-YIG nuclease family protein [Nostoc sp.]|uniref:GIY-YIG nuclease family protein n=1 Tax=Nostoc sp. TaxID=1180 RepID=UPI002FF9A57E